jgi:hypothetical protein
VNAIRLGYWLLVVVLGAWSVVELFPSPPTATKALATNHKIELGDLQTGQIAAMTGRYLRRSVRSDERVTEDMLSESETPPLMPSGFAAVVNLTRQRVEDLRLREGSVVQIKSGPQDLGKPGPIRALVCDPSRCTVVVSVDAAPPFDPRLLNGAELERPPVPLGGGP